MFAVNRHAVIYSCYQVALEVLSDQVSFTSRGEIWQPQTPQVNHNVPALWQSQHLLNVQDREEERTLYVGTWFSIGRPWLNARVIQTEEECRKPRFPNTAFKCCWQSGFFHSLHSCYLLSGAWHGEHPKTYFSLTWRGKWSIYVLQLGILTVTEECYRGLRQFSSLGSTMEHAHQKTWILG